MTPNDIKDLVKEPISTPTNSKDAIFQIIKKYYFKFTNEFINEKITISYSNKTFWVESNINKGGLYDLDNENVRIRFDKNNDHLDNFEDIAYFDKVVSIQKNILLDISDLYL